jgi:hypothetical protein
MHVLSAIMWNAGKIYVVGVTKTGYVDEQVATGTTSSAYMRRTYLDGSSGWPRSLWSGLRHDRQRPHPGAEPAVIWDRPAGPVRVDHRAVRSGDQEADGHDERFRLCLSGQ